MRRAASRKRRWRSRSRACLPANGKPLLYPKDEHIVALATDTPVECRLPQFGLEDYDAIVAFVFDTLELNR